MTNARTRTQEITQVKNPVATDAIAAVQTNNNAFRSALKAGFRRMAKAGVAATAAFTVTMAALGVSPAAAQTSDQGLPYAPIALSKPVADVGQGVQVDYTSFGNMGAPVQGSKLSVLDANGSNALYNGEASVIAQSSGPIGQNPEVGVVEFNRPGTYSVQNLLITGSGEIGSNVAKITVNPDPVVNMQTSPTTIQQGQSVTFTPTVQAGTGTGPFSFGFQVVQSGPNGGTVWDGSIGPGQTSISIPFPNAGQFTVIPTVLDGTGYQSAMGGINLTVTPAQVPTITSPASTTISPDEVLTFGIGNVGSGCQLSFAVSGPNGENALTTLVNNTMTGVQSTEVTVVQSGSNVSLFAALNAPLGNYAFTATEDCNGISTSSSSAFSVQQLTVTAQPNVCSAAPVNTTGFGSGTEAGTMSYDPGKSRIVVFAGGAAGQNIVAELTNSSGKVFYCDLPEGTPGSYQTGIKSDDVSFNDLIGHNGVADNVDLKIINLTAHTVVDENTWSMPSL
jgi:hypothetical protein